MIFMPLKWRLNSNSGVEYVVFNIIWAEFEKDASSFQWTILMNMAIRQFFGPHAAIVSLLRDLVKGSTSEQWTAVAAPFLQPIHMFSPFPLFPWTPLSSFQCLDGTAAAVWTWLSMHISRLLRRTELLDCDAVRNERNRNITKTTENWITQFILWEIIWLFMSYRF